MIWCLLDLLISTFFLEEKILFLWACKCCVKIALGVARGIEYLHHGYDEQIIWFNIKAYNILPHEHFTPKVLNFHQTKLCLIDKIIVSHCITRNTGIYQSISILQKHWWHLL